LKYALLGGQWREKKPKEHVEPCFSKKYNEELKAFPFNNGTENVGLLMIIEFLHTNLPGVGEVCKTG
jgi:hypothetical protein